MEVLNDIVGKNLKIYQDDEYFKFSLESVLLPNFVTINLKDKNILDLCCGNAPIPLILAKKTKAKIYGVELQKEIYDLALKSVKINEKEEQITIINEDVKNLKKVFKGDMFDIITVNPPYFKVNSNSSLNQNIIKAKARHENTLTLEELLKMVTYLLKNNASFYMVHRAERLIEIIETLKKYKLTPKCLQFIYPYEGKESKLFMIKATKNGREGIKVLDAMYIHNEDLTYQDKIKEIFK